MNCWRNCILFLYLQRSLPTAICFLFFSVSSGQSEPSFQQRPLAELEHSRAQLVEEINQLAKFTMRTSVGSLGWSSRRIRNPSGEAEWAQVQLEEPCMIDQIILVPIIWRKSDGEYRADGFPREFRVIVGQSKGDVGEVVASFTPSDQLLPRLAPVVITIPPTEAGWVKVEATQLSQRLLDGVSVLQLAEILVFSGETNFALNQPVRVSSSLPAYQKVDAAVSSKALTDGLLPYVMDTAQADGSFSNVMFFGEGDDVSLRLDLGREYDLSGIRLHVDNISKTVPQAHFGDYGIPMHLRILGSRAADFSDAAELVEFRRESIYAAGPILSWRFPKTTSRFLRLEILEGYKPPGHDPNEECISFSEVEVFSGSENVALGVPVEIPFERILNSYSQANQTSLTDGQNFFGRILPMRAWLNQLAKRHDLLRDLALIEEALSVKYEQQQRRLRLMSWLVGLMAIVIMLSILGGRILRMREIDRVRMRFAADLHDELGANLHAMGLISDVALDVEDRSELNGLHKRLRELSQRSAAAVRDCTNMIGAKEVHISLPDSIKRVTERIATNLDYKISVEGESFLADLPTRVRIDLFYFYKECLVNISRHSGASEFAMNLVATDRDISLTVRDDGIGIDGDDSNSVPPSLQRRARLLKADLTSSYPPDGGTEICLHFQRRRQLFPWNNQ